MSKTATKYALPRREAIAKPDPGPGYRLLEPGEALRPGDEYWWNSFHGWFYSINADNGKAQSPHFYYRREMA
jgi:hypothetical protein